MRSLMIITLILIMQSNVVMAKTTAVIIGSYRKFYPKVVSLIDEFQSYNVDVIAPARSKIINPGEEFPLLEVDKNKSPHDIEMDFLKAVKTADIIYVANPFGYIGLSGSLEMGYAHALGKKIYCLETPSDFSLKMFCKVSNIKSIIRKK